MAGSSRHTQQVSQLNRQVSELQQELMQLKKSQSIGLIRVEEESGGLNTSAGRAQQARPHPAGAGAGNVAARDRSSAAIVAR
eukprot:6873167-Prymnesium_polylepis.2